MTSFPCRSDVSKLVSKLFARVFLFNKNAAKYIKSLYTIYSSGQKQRGDKRLKTPKIHSLVLTVLLFLVFLTTSIGNGQTIASRQISNSGSVKGSGIGELKFFTNFEDATWRIQCPEGSGDTEGYMYIKDLTTGYNMYNYVHQTGYGVVEIDSGTMYANSPTPHSGSKMISAVIPSGSTTRRAELQFRIHDTSSGPSPHPPAMWVTTQYFMRCWYYFSPDWSLNEPSRDNNWASLATLMNAGSMSAGQFVLTVRARINSPQNDPVNGYKLCIGDRGESHTGGPVETTPATWNVSSIRGKWNLLEVFLRNGPDTATNGAIVWWNGVKILEGYGFPTLRGQSLSSWYISIPKTYTDISSAANGQWFDDIEIWDDIP
jgi:hypothetical protein